MISPPPRILHGGQSRMTTSPMTASPTFQRPQVAAAIRSGIGGRQNSRLSPRRAAQRSAAHRRILSHCQQHAQKSLNEGDYLQAAEKSWGAYAQTVKAIGADHQLRIAHHAAIIGVASRLALLVKASDPVAGNVLRYGLATARSLHQHFYENDLPDDAVIESAADVEVAVALLRQLFPPEPAA